jgi:hypothetical protein
MTSSCGTQRNVKFIFSSLASPLGFIPETQQKIHEAVKFFHLAAWDDAEIEGFIRFVATNLGIAFSDSEYADIATASKGSPRFVKTFFLNRHVASQCTALSFPQVLADTKRELA